MAPFASRRSGATTTTIGGASDSRGRALAGAAAAVSGGELLRPASDRRGGWLAWVRPCRWRGGQGGGPSLASGIAAAPRWAHAGAMAQRVVTVNDVLGGHVVLDIECLDRVYLNAYVPVLQSSGQVVAFMTQHLGKPIPSPALMEYVGTRFRKAVESYAFSNGIPWVRFGKEDRKIDVMQPHIEAQAATGRSGVVAVGVSQEFQRVWSAYQRDTATAAPQYTFAKADRRVTCYYFYLWDEDFGPAFIKVCAYFPYPAKIWVNGHEWAKRQAARAGLGYRELSNGFAACGDPAALQQICDRLRPGHHRGVRPTVAAPAAHALRPGRSASGVLVGDLDAPGRGLPHPRAGCAPPGPGVLRGADRRQPGYRPPGQRRDHL